MAQVQLPIFPDGVTRITDEIAFETKDGKVVYYNGHLPVFVHDKDDLATFRFFTSQLTVNGNASQAQIAEAFGVPLVTVKRYVKRFRLGGARAFFAPAAKRSGRRLSAEILPQAQALLDRRDRYFGLDTLGANMEGSAMHSTLLKAYDKLFA